MAKKKQPARDGKTAAAKRSTAGAKKAAGKKQAAAKQKPRAANSRKKPAQAAKSQASQTPAATGAEASRLRQGPEGFPIVGMGASAGGLEALEVFFQAMPHESGMAFVLVAHLDPTHVSILPELLQKRTKMPVSQIRDGMKVQPNHVYVIPPNKNLSILRGALQLMDVTQRRGTNLPIDSFFRALAQDQGRHAVGIVLSGTGTDGTLGVKAIKGDTGMVMVQDEESAKYGGMPRSAMATGLADYVLSPAKMPLQLMKYTAHAALQTAPGMIPTEGRVPPALQKIFVILRTRTNHDFSLYKRNTICRRIERRMNVHQIDDISEYVRYLQESEREVGILLKELLIGVTNFFRDGEGFGSLSTKWLPELLAQKPDDYTVRGWVPGCSSGEEAYSIAIVLHECMERLGRHVHVQIFGTDIDEEAIDTARAGLYPESIRADVGPERLKRYFTEENDGRYRVRKTIREMLVFAPQNVIKDPPFTKLDLLSCRNLLIYLNAELQKRLLPVFHYSLRPEGILFLGSSETTGQNTDLFALLDKKWKIFRRQASSAAPPGPMHFPAAAPPQPVPEAEVSESIQRAEELSALQLVETILEQSDAPPCAIIDDRCNVVYIHGRTGRFLEPAEGKVSVNILEMARPGLKAELASAIRKVGIHKQEIRARGLHVPYNDGHLTMDLTVKPILELTAMRGLMMVVLEETASDAKQVRARPRRSLVKRKGKTADELEQELQYTKENLQTTIEELETSNEELKSTNEELQSTNEELQSTNEELETSKEELQSLNEESATVNAELQARIDELSKANDDMKNLLDSTEIATLFLDTDLRIRRFTPEMTRILPVAATDIGRAATDLTCSLVGVDPFEDALQVLRDLVTRQREVSSVEGRIYLMRVRPYRTVANVINGVVMTFDDITTQRQAEQRLRDSEEKFRCIAETVREVFWLQTPDKMLYVSPAYEQIWGQSADRLYEDANSFLEAIHPDDQDRVAAAYRSGQARGGVVREEFRILRPDRSVRWIRVRRIPVESHADEQWSAGVFEDITERKTAEGRRFDDA